MPNATIDRCTLRIVRRGGWSWGPAPRAIVDSAIAALVRALEDERDADELIGAEGESHSVIRLVVRLKAHELEPDGGLYDGTDRESLIAARIARSLTATLRRESPVSATSRAAVAIAPASESARTPSGSAVSWALQRWHRLGRLRSILSRLDDTLLARWRVLFPDPNVRSASAPSNDAIRDAVAAFWSDALRSFLLRPTPAAPSNDLAAGSGLALQLIAATEAAAALGRSVDDPEIWQAIALLLSSGPDSLMPTISDSHDQQSGGQGPETVESTPERPFARDRAAPRSKEDRRGATWHSRHGVAENGDSGSSTEAAPIGAPVDGAARRTTSPIGLPEGQILLPLPFHTAGASPSAHRPSVEGSSEWEARIDSALPFLLLKPLARIGWLETLAACAEVGGWIELLPLVAVALAYKVLEPARHGWDRPPSAARTGATFAGLATAAPESALVSAARTVHASLTPLAVVVSKALLDGRTRGAPVVLARLDAAPSSAWGLFDSEALCPIAWAVDLDPVLSLVDRCHPDPVLIASGGDPSTLRTLEGRGFRFIVAGEPTRGEHWRDLGRSPAGRLWSNDRTSSTSALLRAAAHLPPAIAVTDAIADHFRVRRQSVPLATDNTLERTVTQAALTSLGTIAWTLWRNRGPVDPVLALERLHDLDARVRFTPSEVIVRVPLGRRHHDLRTAGLLDDVASVPWLAGRRVRFSGG